MAQSREYKNYLRRCRHHRPDVREKHNAYLRKYRAEHPELKEQRKKVAAVYYENNRSRLVQAACCYNSKSCRDPVAGDVCRYNTLVHRKRNHPELYKDIVIKDCIIKVPTIKGMDEQLKREYNME